jgi:hypothetical protein
MGCGGVREAETHGVHSEAASREVYPGGQISHSASLKRVPCTSIILRVSPYPRSGRRNMHPRYDLQRTMHQMQRATDDLRAERCNLQPKSRRTTRRRQALFFKTTCSDHPATHLAMRVSRGRSIAPERQGTAKRVTVPSAPLVG